MGAYAKAIVTALITGFAALQPVLASGHGVTGAQWIGITSAIVTTLAVYVVPNATVPPPVVFPEVPAAQPPEQPSV